MARARDPHPLLGLRPEPLGRCERDQLGRALRLGEEAVPERTRRPLEVVDVGGVGYGSVYIGFGSR
jgi:hypothetical protein